MIDFTLPKLILARWGLPKSKPIYELNIGKKHNGGGQISVFIQNPCWQAMSYAIKYLCFVEPGIEMII